MSLHSEPAYVQEVSLDGVSAIEIHSAHLDLVIEGDSAVKGVARLLAEYDTGTPELQIQGSRLRISQEGRYRGMSAPVLKLPAADLPTLGAHISRGNLSIENLETTLALNLDSGNLQITGGSGETAVNIASGNATIRQREGDIACRLESGNIELGQCRGEVALSVGKGNITTRDCEGRLALKSDKGNITLIRPVDQHVKIHGARTDLQIQGGSLESAEIELARGDINSSAQLLFTAPAEPVEDFDDLSDFEDVIDDAVDDIGEEVRFNLGSVQFIAGEAGVRLSTGGTERFHAGPEGVVIRGRDGEPIFVANEHGVSTHPTASRKRNEQFRFTTGRGSIHLDIPEEQPTRVELIVNRGSVQSDIPLVEVGRPGPRSTTRRYVGVSDSADTDRILVRARTSRGDIRLRTFDTSRETARASKGADRDRQRRAILEALARGRITTDEADILLAAMERDSS